MENNRENVKLGFAWLSFIIYLVLFWLGSVILEQKQLVWLLLEIYVLGIDAFILYKYRFPKQNSLLVAVVLSGIYAVSEIIHLNPLSIFNIGLVFLSICAVNVTFERFPNSALKWFKEFSKNGILKSISIGILFGLICGAINYLLMVSSNQLQPANVLKAFVLSLSPAIIEEIAYRTVFYAFCLIELCGRVQTKWQTFTIYVMMTIPHILPHTVDCFKNGFLSGLIEWVITTILYLLVFGLVFAMLQRKRDISSAMIAHGTVDFMRFCLFGLPF
ncbi:type II CAAX prenyl endopeptidase Rce1 family protein [Streptococcus equinus]|uniref:CPBP family glutamic-type intramembrane protease n=1 Tax=Streptococcus equinus TaxID=1335 RepID=UPI003BF7FF64